MRGRLICPMVATIARLDTVATEAAGQDPEFRTILHQYPGGLVRTSTRRESTAVRVRCQIEVAKLGQLDQQPAGQELGQQVTLVFHYRDLERQGLVHPDGTPAFQPGDRLVDLRRRDGTQIRSWPANMHCTRVEDAGLGLGGHRNLLACTYEDRPQGMGGA